jgi:3-deoxy-D-manno-octulosonate 8-phosphate phosphatase (KDO 8-P phosphatase)
VRPRPFPPESCLSAFALPRLSDDLLARASGVRLAAFDVDGTLTDGQLRYDSQGNETKVFHVHDGLGLKLLLEAGIAVALVSARRSAIVTARAAELGIREVHQGVADKAACLRALCADAGIEPAQSAFMGDDLPDLGALSLCGLPAGPANAHPLLHPYLVWHSELAGGQGAARGLCDLILLAQNRIERVVARFAPA